MDALFLTFISCWICSVAQSQKIVTLKLGGGWSGGDEGYILLRKGWLVGTICADGAYNMKAARVACRELGQGDALEINKNGFYGKPSVPKLVASLTCNGDEARLADCNYRTSHFRCHPNMIAGVMCEHTPSSTGPKVTPQYRAPAAPRKPPQSNRELPWNRYPRNPGPRPRPPQTRPPQTRPPVAPPTYNNGGSSRRGPLPDLVPNKDILWESVFVQRKTLGDLQCAMEENCVSASGLRLRDNDPNFGRRVRFLLRFSSNVKNVGDADFRPDSPRSTWQWHQCHKHFHSMESFALYDIFDRNGVKQAEGHKASYCLMDMTCDRPDQKKFDCGTTNEEKGGQGISVGCSDDYTSDLDCQWIDITDLRPGDYILRVHVNPSRKVPEKRYDNNMVSCDISYGGGTSISTPNCRHGL